MKLKSLRPGTWFADIDGDRLVADRVDGCSSYAIFENGRFRGYEHSLAGVRSNFESRGASQSGNQ